jgi:hypothetical protein
VFSCVVCRINLADDECSAQEYGEWASPWGISGFFDAEHAFFS